MILTIRVSKDPQGHLPPNTERVFDTQGGTIGRANGNDLVLPDPERYLSSRHAAIYFENGQFFLTDTSANGVFVNDSDSPVGADQAVVLNDGDRLTLGDYELTVSLQGSPTAEPADFLEPAPMAPVGVVARPVRAPAGLAVPIPADEVLDPLELLSGGGRAPKRVDTGSVGDLVGAERDDVPMVGSAFQPPRTLPTATIPDDWDEDLAAPSAKPAAAPPRTPARSAPPAGIIPEDFDDLLAPAAPAPPAQRPADPPRVEPPASPAVDLTATARDTAPRRARRPAKTPPEPPAPERANELEGALATFLNAAGLDPAHVPAGREEQILKLAGTMFRQLIEDLREVLIARALLKSGLRMEVTRIAPTDNNPLKFSAGGVEEALEKLLFKHGKGYMDPVQAVHEGFQDIKEHQVAMVAGVKAAAAAVLSRFDPQHLEQEFDAKGGVGLLSSRKARNWEMFEALYAQLKAAADEGRDEVFTEAFGGAYEEQIDSLRKARER